MIVVAAILEDATGRVLLAQRPPGKHDAGLWELPGGKIEPGESAFAALQRELREELDIEIAGAARFMRVRRDRAGTLLVLEAWRVMAWRGETRALEHTALAWNDPGTRLLLPLCDADVPIWRTLSLPSTYAITPDIQLEDMPALLDRVESALQRGLRMLQWRAPSLNDDDFRSIALQLRALTSSYGARMLVNADVGLAIALGADGVHLSASQMRGLQTRPRLPDKFLVAASCHDADELTRAAAIGADFVVLGPVLETRSHPDATTLGWEGMRSLCEASDLPVYALGGLTPEHLGSAREHGAFGVAGISAFC